jgi:ABC-2 type transport system ATP-binding protein
MIQAEGLTKRYGAKTAVNDINFTVKPGMVTGFLGPNGAGKSTTMRMIVGLDRPSSGRVTVNGAKAIHTGRSAYNHLLAMGATHGIGKSRVDEVIGLTGLESVAGKRVGGFSLGMGQRLGIAAALLGDPATLILDEPVNGLDPEGVMWVRQLARHLASEGRTIFLSSHLMSEMALTADHLIVLGRGRIIADAPVADILARSTRTAVKLRSPRAEQLAQLLQGADVTITTTEHEALTVTGLTAPFIGDAAARAGIPLHELTPVSASLEEAYMELTQDDVEYHAGGAAAVDVAAPTNTEEVAR